MDELEDDLEDMENVPPRKKIRLDTTMTQAQGIVAQHGAAPERRRVSTTCDFLSTMTTALNPELQKSCDEAQSANTVQMSQLIMLNSQVKSLPIIFKVWELQ
ncbi:hypothetical protein E1B28_005121 [Marasmius oreades]|uniref:Uncharacterized protein n=1 Tax=Marasmius oreades TaxID=181124 RepID=A0A9P7V035_9AGAR|nr:uncharacterized protein E1B28_005121 [Marasmius oreades]KAG7097802.1 hypothetical protein E1B28_005121 [Marasmius oreades]